MHRVLGFTKKYSRTSLEECCRRALAAERATYTYIKNTIGAVAEELGSSGYNTDKNKKRNEGAYIMDSGYSDMNKLLDRSRALADQSGKGGTAMNTGTKELKSILEELDELKLPHMAAELEDLYNQPDFVDTGRLELISEYSGLKRPGYRGSGTIVPQQ